MGGPSSSEGETLESTLTTASTETGQSTGQASDRPPVRSSFQHFYLIDENNNALRDDFFLNNRSLFRSAVAGTGVDIPADQQRAGPAQDSPGGLGRQQDGHRRQRVQNIQRTTRLQNILQKL